MSNERDPYRERIEQLATDIRDDRCSWFEAVEMIEKALREATANGMERAASIAAAHNHGFIMDEILFAAAEVRRG